MEYAILGAISSVRQVTLGIELGHLLLSNASSISGSKGLKSGLFVD